MVIELSRPAARRIAVRAQLLDSPRPTEVLEVVRHLTLLQIDATASVARDATLERAEGVLRVDARYEDEPFSPSTVGAVRTEIDDLATWLGVETMLLG